MRRGTERRVDTSHEHQPSVWAVCGDICGYGAGVVGSAVSRTRLQRASTRGGGASLVGVDSANTMRALCVVAQSAGSTPVVSTSPASGQSAATSAATGQELSDQQPGECVSSKSANAESVERGQPSRIRASDSRLVVGKTLADLESTPVREALRPTTTSSLGQSATRPAAAVQKLSDQRSVERVSSELVRAGKGASLVGVDSANTMRALCVVAQSAGSIPIMSAIPASGQPTTTSAATVREL